MLQLARGKLAPGESQFMPLHPSMYVLSNLHIMERERERQGQLSINAAACLTHLVAGGLEFPAAQPEVCISWSPRSVLQLHPTPFSSQSSIELSFRSIST
jgi:hypothetical protein